MTKIYVIFLWNQVISNIYTFKIYFQTGKKFRNHNNNNKNSFKINKYNTQSAMILKKVEKKKKKVEANEIEGPRAHYTASWIWNSRMYFVQKRTQLEVVEKYTGKNRRIVFLLALRKIAQDQDQYETLPPNCERFSTLFFFLENCLLHKRKLSFLFKYTIFYIMFMIIFLFQNKINIK